MGLATTLGFTALKGFLSWVLLYVRLVGRYGSVWRFAGCVVYRDWALGSFAECFFKVSRVSSLVKRPVSNAFVRSSWGSCRAFIGAYTRLVLLCSRIHHNLGT